ncbi:natural killer cell receptor 2B4 [Chiroxiphia lanceolata]|uniref:natural killer cell receptor 2B4 n=1 Tax=Chiroxiphia lanceolata TaxID=296741 RepID=UPI0013CEC118|nr:natural killer cell receptor 2B4 [Chiroxiphia lanceolata]
MLRCGGPRCPPALLLLLLVVVASGRGARECRERAVSSAGMLELRPERHQQGWTEVHWRVDRSAGPRERILTARRDGSVSYTRGSFPGRAVFQPETLSLRISPVRREDSGVYKIEFEDPSGAVAVLSFCVRVWDPIPWPELQAQTLHREQGWCNISLSCSVPAPGSVSYSWNCSGDPSGAPPGHHNQPRLLQRVPVDADPTLCLCNASNPVSWGVASADIAGICRRSDLSHLILWPAVASAVALPLFLLVVTCCWWRKRRKKTPEAPPGHVEEPLTIYEEVGRDKSSQDPDGTLEPPQAPNTVYAVVCPPKQQEEPRCQRCPGSCTLYSVVQPGRRVRLSRFPPDPPVLTPTPCPPRAFGVTLPLPPSPTLPHSLLPSGGRGWTPPWSPPPSWRIWAV